MKKIAITILALLLVPIMGWAAEVTFNADTQLDLSGLPTTLYIKSGSQCDSFSVSGAILNVDIPSASTFTLGTAGYTVLSLAPSGGALTLNFDTSNFTTAYITKWIASSITADTTVSFSVGVPKANTYYWISADGVSLGYHLSNSSAVVSFTYHYQDGFSSVIFEITRGDPPVGGVAPSSPIEEVEEEVEEDVATEEEIIVDGDTIRNPNAEGEAQFDIYIVKIVGSKKFKRLILSPHVFESYGHLKWEDVKNVSQSVMDEYTTSDLVRAEGDFKVYRLTPDGDTGTKQWLNMTVDEFVTQGYDWDAIYIINTTDRDAYTTGAEIAVGEAVTEEIEAVTETIVIKAYALRVRSLPSLDGEILTLVHQGEVYELLDEQNGWYKITTQDGITGWCFGGETGGYAVKQ
jgi:hypothetical protein